ncbi:MAG: hypothetical protein NC921_00940 [Candidatus Omnitrophica bacterium]|nr:hypothetical protein [Candidatus Omnitrophota bacterium]
MKKIVLFVSLLFFSFLYSEIELIYSSFFGTEQDDDIQSACEGPDGSIYIVGNLGEEKKINIKKFIYGKEITQPNCGIAFIMRLSPDLKRIINYAEFKKGIAIFTTVKVNKFGVYVGGYATEELEDIIKNLPGIIKTYPLKEEMKLIKEGKILEKNGIFSEKDPIADRPHLGRYGAPFVVLLSHDLGKILGGTYLEGWQQVWDKDRVKRIKPREFFDKEFFWQKTLIDFDNEGNVILCHDGGYFKIISDEEKEKAKKISGEDQEKYKKLVQKIGFYDVPDFVSKLTSDLSKRFWKTPIYTPIVNVDVAKEIKDGWYLPHYGNPRTHQLRVDKNHNIWICGWSASATKAEPWWSPYLIKIDSKEGKILQRLYEYDPMSGDDNRMFGQVADTAITCFNFDKEDKMLIGLLSDGGNTVMWWSPKGELRKKFEGEIKGDKFVKLVHWWGMIHKIDLEKIEGIIGVGMTSKGVDAPGPAWAVDLGILNDNSILVVGRCNHEFYWSEDAFQKSSSEENPIGFIRIYSKDFDLKFSSALPGVIPLELIPLSGKRYLIVGYALNPSLNTKNEFEKYNLKKDGFIYLIKEKE